VGSIPTSMPLCFCSRGVIGSHGSFRGYCRKAWGFKSLREHHFKENEKMNTIVTPVIDYGFRLMCSNAYPNHPKGCPNFGKRNTCPPNVPKFEEYYDCTKSFYIIWTIFPFGEHLEKMKVLHSDWSERQLSCCLYWQGTARKNLKLEIAKFKALNPDLTITTCPEAMGVNITSTMASIGEKLEWPPRTITYQVAIAGRSR
jgi:predicted metal-binding protein